MLEFTHITARYLKSLASGGPDYSGQWVVIRISGEKLEFNAFGTEAEAEDELEAGRDLGDAIMFRFPG